MEEPTKLKSVKNKLENNWIIVFLVLAFIVFISVAKVFSGYQDIKSGVQSWTEPTPTAPANTPPATPENPKDELSPIISELLNKVDLQNYQELSEKIGQHLPLDYTVYTVRNQVEFKEGNLRSYIKNLAFKKQGASYLSVVKIDKGESFLKVNIKE